MHPPITPVLFDPAVGLLLALGELLARLCPWW
jgi:hypothetical protein